MKIISKYKDFYDYLWMDSDPDLVYVRKERYCYSLVSELHAGLSKNMRIGEGVPANGSFYRMSPGAVKFTGFTFGIYPCVYTTPALLIFGSDILTYYIKCLSRKEVDAIHDLKNTEPQREYINTLCSDFLRGVPSAPKDVHYDFPSFGRCTPYDDIIEYCWKVENQDIFLKFGSPVFIVYSSNILGDAYQDIPKPDDVKNEKLLIVNNEIVTYINAPRFVTNVCFNKLNFPVTKYWFDELNSLNTYSNIENFLMTSKLDPEPVISNEGKIVAHGFDLKTSFRKM